MATSDDAAPLSRSALTGVAWNWTGSAVLIVAQIASTAATARLVAPDEFGAYATAQAAAGFAGYFTLAAVGPGLQRRSRIDARTIGTAVALTVTASLLIATLLWLGAGLWVRAWNIPDAISIVRIIAISMLFSSAAVVPIALLRRQLQFRRAALIETASLVFGLAVGVGLAAAHHNATALAVGHAAGSAGLFLLAALSAKEVWRPAFDREQGRELFSFAGQVSGLNFLAYFTNTLPSWFVARTFGASVLGFFSRANLIVALPAEYAVTSVFKVVYPLYGRVREDLARTRALIDEALTLTTGLVWPLFALVAGAAPVIVGLLLGDRWEEAGPLLALFALMACAWIPCGLLTNAAEAFGWMRVIARRQLTLLATIVLTLALADLGGLSLTALLAGVAACEWLVYALTLRPFLHRGLLDGRVVLRCQIIQGGLAIGAYAAAAGCAELLEQADLLVRAGAQALIGLAVMAIIISGRSWIPATGILARRIGADPNQNLIRAGWAALR